jgi:hypothetical protein
MLRTRSSILPIEDQPRRDPFGHYALRNNSRKQRWVLALLGISGRSVRLLAGARMACWLQQKRCAALLRLARKHNLAFAICLLTDDAAAASATMRRVAESSCRRGAIDRYRPGRS